MEYDCANCSTDTIEGAVVNATTLAPLLDWTTMQPSPPNLTEWENQFLKDFKYTMNVLLGISICVLGLLGNILTMIIMTRRNMRSSTNCYLLSLAIWDSVVLVCTPFMTGFRHFEQYESVVFPFIIPYVYPLALTAQTTTIWLTVSFTVERYIAVCHPMRASSMCTIQRARIVIMVVSAVSCLYNVTRWLEYETVVTEVVTDSVNTTQYTNKPTAFMTNPVYQRVYFTYLYLPMMCIIPLVTLALLNTFLIMTVRRSSQRRREEMNVRQSRENNVTLMLSSVVIVFIICQVPALVYNMAYGIDEHYVSHSFGYQILSEVRNFSVTLNSAMNIILYCVFGQKFRQTFIQTFCRCFIPPEQLTTFGSIYSNGHYSTGDRSSRKIYRQSIEMNANTKKRVITFNNGNYEKRRLERQILLENNGRHDSHSKGSNEDSHSDPHHRYYECP